ncbi:MAG: phosphatase PAP2 family protein [Paludibacteraceae bacterium]|nr:phosphatase PAP2 family protein [Paludibacteraceae bacterium]
MMETDNKNEQENPIPTGNNGLNEEGVFTLEKNQPQKDSSNTNSSKKKRKKIFKNIAKAISFIFFPLLMPVYGTFMLFNMKLFTYYPIQYVDTAKKTIYIFGIILPCLSFIILKLFKAISDVRVPRKEERLIPYICIACCYLYCAYLLYRNAMPMWVINLVLCVSFVIFVESIISQFWRISGHATSMGLMAGAIIVTGYCTYTNVCVTLCVFVFIAGIVGSARLYLKRHTDAQLIAGFFFGLLSVLFIAYVNPGQIFRVM